MIFSNIFYFLCIFTLFSHIVLNESAQEQIKIKYKKYCKKDYNDKIDKRFKLKQKKFRNKRDNKYFNNQKKIFKFLTKGRDSEVIKITMIPFILILCYASIVFLIICLYIFTCFRFWKFFRCKSLNISWIFSVILLIALLVCFIVGIVFATKASKARNEAFCYFYRIQYNISEISSTQTNINFIGLNKIKKIAENFINEIPIMIQKQYLYNKIIKANYLNEFKKVENSLQNFIQRNKNIKTFFDSKNKKIPISNLNLEYHINPQINTEFKEIGQLSQGLLRLAQVGQRLYKDQTYKQTLQFVIGKIKDQADSVQVFISDFFDKSKNLNKIKNHLQYGRQITTFSTIFLILLFLAAILLSISYRCKKFAHGVMITACCLLIIISIAYMFWIFGLAEISGVCGIMRDINTGNYKDENKFEFESEGQEFIQACMTKNHRNDIIKNIFTTEEEIKIYNDYEFYLDTLVSYKYFLDSNKQYSHEIFKQQDKWRSIQVGINYDHLNIKNQLKKFNEQIKCSERKYDLTTQSCNDKCRSILTTFKYERYSCIDNKIEAENDELFYDLQLYIQDAQNNISRLIQEIGQANNNQNINSERKNFCNNNQDTPQQLFIQYLNYLRQQKQDIEQITNIHSEFYSLYQSSNKNFHKSLDCSNIYNDSLRLEYQACYKLAFHHYNAIIVWLCILIISFLFLITIIWVMGKNKLVLKKKVPVYNHNYELPSDNTPIIQDSTLIDNKKFNNNYRNI